MYTYTYYLPKPSRSSGISCRTQFQPHARGPEDPFLFWIEVNICVYVCIYICICTYIHMCTYICMQMYIHMFEHMCICIYAYTYIHLSLYIYVYTHVYAYPAPYTNRRPIAHEKTFRWNQKGAHGRGLSGIVATTSWQDMTCAPFPWSSFGTGPMLSVVHDAYAGLCCVSSGKREMRRDKGL